MKCYLWQDEEAHCQEGEEEVEGTQPAEESEERGDTRTKVPWSVLASHEHILFPSSLCTPVTLAGDSAGMVVMISLWYAMVYGFGFLMSSL